LGASNNALADLLTAAAPNDLTRGQLSQAVFQPNLEREREDERVI
jgi:Ca2+-binding EF-hand superfamily protein